MLRPKMRRAAAAGKPADIAKPLRPVPLGPDPADAPRVAEIFRRFQAREPEPATELTYKNAFTLLVAVALSAQATDVSVNKATPALFAKAPTPAAMVALGEDGIRDCIKTIGLYNAKARNVLALSERLVSQHGGAVPRERAALEALPGVGKKTAAVVVNALWGDPAIAVDTHVFRVSNRIPLARGTTPDAVETGLMQIVPERFRRHAHHWLILHGRYTCTARRPACPRCLIQDLCLWPDKTAAAPAE
jgi:endonuclease III